LTPKTPKPPPLPAPLVTRSFANFGGGEGSAIFTPFSGKTHWHFLIFFQIPPLGAPLFEAAYDLDGGGGEAVKVAERGELCPVNIALYTHALRGVKGILLFLHCHQTSSIRSYSRGGLSLSFFIFSRSHKPLCYHRSEPLPLAILHAPRPILSFILFPLKIDFFLIFNSLPLILDHLSSY
jgi:hypothetical protein